MAILARGQITITIAEKGEDGKDYNNYNGEWYIGARGVGHSFEFSPAPADTTSAELKIYQKDLESEIKITINGHTITEHVNGGNGVLDWKTYRLDMSHIHFTEYNVIRIEHNGSATADWGYIYRAILQFSVKGEKGEQGDKGDKGDKGLKGDKGEAGDIIYLRGTGFNRSNYAIIKINENQIITGNNRGMYLMVLHRYNLRIDYVGMYDTYSSYYEAESLANKINSYDDNFFIMLVSYEAVGWNYPLVAALENCGSRGTFYKQNDCIPFAFMGYPGLKQGLALEYQSTANPSAPYAEISTNIIEGQFVGIGTEGAQGDKGEQGDKGDKGNKGDDGENGEKGEKGEKGDQGGKGDSVINLYKASYNKPAKPTGTAIPPSGWGTALPSSDSKVTLITYDSTRLTKWREGEDGFWVSQDTLDSMDADMFVSFTTHTSPQTIAIDVRVSSEKNCDKLLISGVDDSAILKVFSGEVDERIYIDVPTAGFHKMKFAYEKDGSADAGSDNAQVRIATILPVTIWLSVASTINGVLSFTDPLPFVARDGATGRSLFYRGEFLASKSYCQNAHRVDVVKYNSYYYIYKGANNLSSPWNASNWESFGAEFESVATNLLLAENANIADWIIKDGKIVSESNVSSSRPNCVLDGENGGIEFNSTVNKYTSSGAVSTVQQSIKISSSTARVEATNSDHETAYISSQGIFTNRAGIQALLATSGTELKAAVVALGFGDLQQSAYSNKGALCGLYADSGNRNSDPAPSWGAYIRKLLAQGLYLKVRRITISTYLDCYDTCVACYNTGSANIYLPPNPQVGQLIIFTIFNTIIPVVYGNGKPIFASTSAISSYPAGARRGSISFYLYDGQYWKYGYLNA